MIVRPAVAADAEALVDIGRSVAAEDELWLTRPKRVGRAAQPGGCGAHEHSGVRRRDSDRRGRAPVDRARRLSPQPPRRRLGLMVVAGEWRQASARR